jgi:hypothetical protein
MPNDSPSINLAKNRQTPFFDKFINWALTIGRLIVIITEVVAIIVFVYRFSLDEKLADIHSSIKQKQNLVLALKSDENKYRNLQDRITLAANFATKATKSSQTITDVVNLIPAQIGINNLILNNDEIKININTSSISSLEGLVEALKNYKNIKSISIDNIENKPSVGLSVDITTILK